MSNQRGNKKNTELSVDELRARAVAQLSSYITENDRIEEFGVGHWFKPQGFEDWHFVRFDNRLGFHKQTAATMQSQGYQIAPKGTRLVGFEEETEHNLYLCAPPEIFLALRERKREAKLQRARMINDSFGGHIGGIENIAGAGAVTVNQREFTEPAPGKR